MKLLIARETKEDGKIKSKLYSQRMVSNNWLNIDLGIGFGLVDEVIINKESCRVSFIAPYDTKGHIVTDGNNMELSVNTFGPQIRLNYKLTELKSRVSFISPNEEISFTTRE